MPTVRSALALSLGSLLCVACYDRPSPRDDGAALLPAVEAVEARSGRLPLRERLPGVVHARNQVEIRSELSARVAEVMAQSGDAVESHQALVRLDDASLGDQRRQAEASLRLAEASSREARARVAELEAQVRRSRVLVEENLISDLDLETQEARLEAARAGAEQAEAAVDQARATLEERETAFGKTLVRAPVAGRVGRREVEPGSLVDPGSVLFVIGDLSRLRVEVSLTESMLGYIREGQRALISAPALGEDVAAGTLSRISPFLRRGSFSTVGEIDVLRPEERLRPGMFVTVDVLYGESPEATQVPASAIWEDPATGVEGIFVATVDRALSAAGVGEGTDAASGGAGGVGEVRTVSFRPVEVLIDGDGAAAVRGVDEGEWVVTVGQHLLRADEPVSARVGLTTWEEVSALESLKREDVLQRFLARQRESARTLGARPPTKDEMLERMRREREGGGAAAPEDAAGAPTEGGEIASGGTRSGE